MTKYLGEYPSDVVRSPAEWALAFIERYGQIDGAHHKAWVMDQVARILHGTPVLAREARWDSGECELRYHTDVNPSEAYLKWAEEMTDGGYDYDIGIAP